MGENHSPVSYPFVRWVKFLFYNLKHKDVCLSDTSCLKMSSDIKKRDIYVQRAESSINYHYVMETNFSTSYFSFSVFFLLFPCNKTTQNILRHEGNQNFTTMKLLFGMRILSCLLRNNLWKNLGPYSCFLPKRCREICFRMEILECCFSLIRIKYSK